MSRRPTTCLPCGGTAHGASTRFCGDSGRRSAPGRSAPAVCRGRGGLCGGLCFAEDRLELMATTTAAGERATQRPARADAEPAVVALLERHGGRLMSVARRYSHCREDAEDAYQRAVEILLVRAPSVDVGDLLPWMKTVVKHEAFAVTKQRARHGTPSEACEIEP